MKQKIELPSSAEFRKTIEHMVKRYGIVDCVYRESIKEFNQIKLSQLEEIHKDRILRAFLLNWGQMGRWLGFNGVDKIFIKLKNVDFATRVEKLRSLKLQLINLTEYRKEIISIFNELSQTEFETKLKKVKRVGPTSTSKVLHLCCPDLFVMWDAKIREGYSKYEGNGKQYFEFLCIMQYYLHELSDIIKQLTNEYGLKPTRLLDMYNWVKFSKNR